jgi:hypothetical protein
MRPLIIHISSDEDFHLSLERAVRCGYEIILVHHNAVAPLLATVAAAGNQIHRWEDFRNAAVMGSGKKK